MGPQRNRHALVLSIMPSDLIGSNLSLELNREREKLAHVGTSLVEETWNISLSILLPIFFPDDAILLLLLHSLLVLLCSPEPIFGLLLILGLLCLSFLLLLFLSGLLLPLLPLPPLFSLLGFLLFPLSLLALLVLLL